VTPPGGTGGSNPTGGTLTALFRRTARWYADETAFRQHETGESYTYGEVDALACQFANRLTAAGLSKGDRVAFLSRSRIDHAACYFGVQKFGGVPTTLHERESTADVVAMVRDVSPRAVVFQRRFAEAAASVRDHVEGIDTFVAFDDGTGVPDFADSFEAFVTDAPSTEPDVDVRPEDPGVIVFSSGTTGRPKGVVHTHENLAWACHLGHYFYEVRDSDLALFALAPSFVAWQDQIISWVSVGATVLFRETFDAATVLDCFEQEGITSVTLVPTHWQRLFEAGLADREVDSLRVVGYSGAPIGEATLERLDETFPDAAYTAYGSTETLNAVTKLTPERVDPEAPGKLGRPIAAVDVRIVEPSERDPSAELDRGQVGEIVMTGPCIADEIWKNEAATERRFVDGWWFSGDLGRIGPDGNLHLEGRTDNMIVSGGINIYAERVETVLGSHDAVSAVAILGTDDEEWGEVVTAVVVPDGDVTEAELDEWCTAHEDLADYQRPRRYVFVDEMPTTSTGKKDHSALRDWVLDE
jgi:fatty-acyl-CoA synthase